MYATEIFTNVLAIYATCKHSHFISYCRSYVRTKTGLHFTWQVNNSDDDLCLALEYRNFC